MIHQLFGKINVITVFILISGGKPMTKLIVNQTFGHNLQRIRHDSGLTQEQTVERLQLLGSPLSRSTYSLIELGRGNLFVSDLVGLQKIFNVDFAVFFDGITVPR